MAIATSNTAAAVSLQEDPPFASKRAQPLGGVAMLSRLDGIAKELIGLLETRLLRSNPRAQGALRC